MRRPRSSRARVQWRQGVASVVATAVASLGAALCGPPTFAGQAPASAAWSPTTRSGARSAGACVASAGGGEAPGPAEAAEKLHSVLVVPEDGLSPQVAHGGVVVCFEELLEATVAREGMENGCAWRVQWAEQYHEAAGAWLLWAVQRGDAEEVVSLLGVMNEDDNSFVEDEEKKNKQKKDAEDWPPVFDVRGHGAFHLAALRGDTATTLLLYEHCSASFKARTLNAKDVRSLTPLMLALGKRHWEEVLTLLEIGGKPGVTARLGTAGRTLLHWAVADNRAEVARWLVEELDSQLEARDSASHTPLVLAARTRQWDAADVLIGLGANLAATDHRKRSVLSLASASARAAFIKRLVERNAELEARDAHGWTPLFHAVAHDNPEGVDVLLQLGANLSAADNHGFTLLDVAIRKHRWPIIDTLLNWEGADWTSDDLDQALGVAVRRGWWSVAEDLLSRGADVCAKMRGARGWTPLMYVAQAGELATATAMIDYGADVMAKNRRGLRARTIAMNNGHADVANLILKEEQRVSSYMKRRLNYKDISKYSAAWERVSKYSKHSY